MITSESGGDNPPNSRCGSNTISPPLPDRQLRRFRCVKNHQRTKKSEDNGPTPPLDQMQRSPRPIQILLGKWKPELGRLQHKISPPPLSRIQKNAIFRKTSQRHQIPVRFQQGFIVPGARWNLLPPGTLTCRAYTAT